MFALRYLALVVLLAASFCPQTSWAQGLPPGSDVTTPPPVPGGDPPPPAEEQPPSAAIDNEAVDHSEVSGDEAVEDDKPLQLSARVPGQMAPSMGGLTGLLRVVTTDIGDQHTFRVGLHTEIFSQSDFLVSEDSNTRFIGTLALSYTPWKYLEVFANIKSMANKNTRPFEENRLDPELILALGDFTFGAKGQYPVLPYLGVGLNFGLTFLNSVGGISPDGDSTTFQIGLLSTFDVEPLADFPVRIHFNFGYILDNSDNLTGDQFANYSLASTQVEKFALGINRQRLYIRLGVDLPLRRYIKLFGLTPMLEFGADVATGDTDKDFDNARFLASSPAPGKVTADQIDGKSTVWTTIGVRANPLRGLNATLGVDIGISSPGYGYGPPVVPWNLIFGLAYSYDTAPVIKVVKSEPVVKEVVKEVAPPVGRIRGRVVNANTLEPVEGAVVTFPGKDLTGLYADPDGTFQTYQLAPGNHAMMVRKEGFELAKMMTTVTEGQVTTVEIKLKPEPPKVGTLRGRVENLKGNAVVATVKVSGAETKEARVGASGEYSLEVKPGLYEVTVEARNYLRKRGQTTVDGGKAAVLNFTISPKPRKRLVRVSKNAIAKFAKIKFATGSSEIKKESRQLLDALVDGLLGNTSIRKIEVQGHTDNRGSLAKNNQLSQARADAVRTYLVKNGIKASRLMAKGYGPSRPKRPNITKRNRAINRRVEFVVLETE